MKTKDEKVSEKRVLTLTETAQWLKLSEMTILKLVKEKKIPAIKVGRQWRFSHERLMKLFDQTDFWEEGRSSHSP